MTIHWYIESSARRAIDRRHAVRMPESFQNWQRPWSPHRCSDNPEVSFERLPATRPSRQLEPATRCPLHPSRAALSQRRQPPLSAAPIRTVEHPVSPLPPLKTRYRPPRIRVRSIVIPDIQDGGLTRRCRMTECATDGRWQNIDIMTTRRIISQQPPDTLKN